MALATPSRSARPGEAPMTEVAPTDLAFAAHVQNHMVESCFNCSHL